MTIERPMFPPRAERLDSFSLQAATGQRERERRLSESRKPADGLSRRAILAGVASAAALPLAAAAPATATADPIFAVIKRHRAASVVWNAAVDVRSDLPEGPEPMSDKLREQRDILDVALDTARNALNKTGVDLISTVPATLGGIASAIAYIQRQMRDDGTFMPHDIEFHFDVGCEGDCGVVLGWIDAFLNTMAVAVSELDQLETVRS